MYKIIYRRSVRADSNDINNLFIEMIKTINKRMVLNGDVSYNALENGYEDGYLDRFYKDDSRVIFVAVLKIW